MLTAYLLVLKYKGGKIQTRARTFSLRPGYYIYVGSAKKGALSRIKYHERKEKKCFWHIDFLLKNAELVAAIALEGDESVLAQNLSGQPIPGFGCSDTKDPSHLFWYCNLNEALSDAFQAIARSRPGRQESTPPKNK